MADFWAGPEPGVSSATPAHEGWFHKILRWTNLPAAYAAKKLGKLTGVSFPEPPSGFSDYFEALVPKNEPPSHRILAGAFGNALDIFSNPISYITPEFKAGEETRAVYNDLKYLAEPWAKEAIEGAPSASIVGRIENNVPKGILRIPYKWLDEVSELAARKRLATQDFMETGALKAENPEQVRRIDILNRMASLPEERVKPLKNQIYTRLLHEKSPLNFEIPFFSGTKQRIPGGENLAPLLERIGNFLKGREPYPSELAPLVRGIEEKADRGVISGAKNLKSIEELLSNHREAQEAEKALEETENPEVKEAFENLNRAQKLKNNLPEANLFGPKIDETNIRKEMHAANNWFQGLMREKQEGLIPQELAREYEAVKNGLTTRQSDLVRLYGQTHLVENIKDASGNPLVPKDLVLSIKKLISDKMTPDTKKLISQSLENVPLYKMLTDLGGKPITSGHYFFPGKNGEIPIFMTKNPETFNRIETTIAKNLIKGEPLTLDEEAFLKNITDLTMNSQDPVMMQQFVSRIRNAFPNHSFDLIIGNGLESPRLTARIYAPYEEVLRHFPNISEGIPPQTRYFGGLWDKRFPGVEIHPESLNVRQILTKTTGKVVGENYFARKGFHPEIIERINKIKFGEADPVAIREFVKNFNPGIYDNPNAEINTLKESAEALADLQGKTDKKILPGLRIVAPISMLKSAPLPDSLVDMAKNSVADWVKGDWITHYIFRESGFISSVLNKIPIVGKYVGPQWDKIKKHITDQAIWLLDKARTRFDMTFGISEEARALIRNTTGKLEEGKSHALAVRDMIQEQWGSLRKENVSLDDFLKTVFRARAYDDPNSLPERDEALALLQSQLKNREDAHKILNDFQSITDNIYGFIEKNKGYKPRYVPFQIVGKYAGEFLQRINPEGLPKLPNGKINVQQAFQEMSRHFRNWKEYDEYFRPKIEQFIKDKMASGASSVDIQILDRADQAIGYYIYEAYKANALRNFFEKLPLAMPNNFIPTFRLSFQRDAINRALNSGTLTDAQRIRLQGWANHLNSFKDMKGFLTGYGTDPVMEKLSEYSINPNAIPFLRDIQAKFIPTWEEDFPTAFMNSFRGLISLYKGINTFNPSHAARIFDDMLISPMAKTFLLDNLKEANREIKEGIGNPFFRRALSWGVIKDGDSEWNLPFTDSLLEKEPSGFWGATIKNMKAINNKTVWHADKVMRLSLFKYFTEKLGMSDFHAAEATDHYLIDYSLRYMPEGTKKLVRMVFPFYSWLSGNIALHAQEFVRQPAKYLARLRIIEAINIGNAGHDMESNPDQFLERMDIGINPATGEEVFVSPAGLMPSLMLKGLADDVYMNGMDGILIWLKTRMWGPLRSAMNAGGEGYGQAPKRMQEDISQRLKEFASSGSKVTPTFLLDNLWGLQQIAKMGAGAIQAQKRGQLLNYWLSAVPYATFTGMNPRDYPTKRIENQKNLSVFQLWSKLFDKYIFF